MRTWVYTGNPARVVFGSGTLLQVRDEVTRLGRSRVLLVASQSRKDAVARVTDVLGDLAVAWFDQPAAHTPVEVTEKALEVLREHDADCVVAVGGGSATGLAKALAWRTDVDQVILPTTYSGSEATPVLGETQDGAKTTRSAPSILPEAVIYDVGLTVGLPVATSVTSSVNALAHAVEALYSAEANPLVDTLALQSISGISSALPWIAGDPADLEVRADLLRSAWLAGLCLASVGMGLHHRLCHTLGGSFGLPHAETHTVVLPHVMAYNAPAVPDVMARIAATLGGSGGDAPARVAGLISSAGGPRSLRELGMTEADIVRAAELAAAKPYPNPRPVTTDGLTELLLNAWHGAPPGVPRPPAGRH